MKKFILIFLALSSLSYAADEGGFGLSEENLNAARKTLNSVRPHLDNAMRYVSDVIYPNLQIYQINTKASIIQEIVNFLDGSSARLSSSNENQFKSYRDNPYIARLVVISNGLRLQMRFTSDTGVQSQTGTTAKIPIFEAFMNKRIILIPVFNIDYDGNNNIINQDREISTWECLSDADESISISGTTIAEGMRSVISLAGGNMGSCQYISSSHMNQIWHFGSNESSDDTKSRTPDSDKDKDNGYGNDDKYRTPDSSEDKDQGYGNDDKISTN